MAAFTVPTLSLVPVLLLLAVVFTFPTGTASISTREYESMQRVLRNHGYNLICNAMATSDLQYELLTLPPNASFTVFAPTDASLFALDMIQTASYYIDTLRVHVVPLRFSVSDLRSISSGSILPTLLPYRALRLSTDPLAVSGVDVVLPGLFYSRRVAVHGLGGIVSLSSVVPYGSHLQASAPVASGGADKVAPLKTVSNRTDLSPAATPPSEAVSLMNAHSNGTASADLSPVVSELPATTASPSPPTDSTASEDTPSASPPSPSADSVPERARALLMEISDGNSDSEGDEISEKSPLLMEAQAVGEVKKCGALDEMTIDCFVPEDGDGLEKLSLQRLVRALA
ncbi:putative FAS1 domain-containing protein [Rosa chinensis]|uniref:Putative FAS1 domain-containing protein n=1 Tax=Rosa chinensis TaxID=74649 RepID=A0A2P6PDI4_ROSCH|nr:fasciclin-like arabinogalactan protein 19 [Rosa chinensis]PRQ19989.1 putative FAS1 domain-containing protein [Rosa chinensis]